MGFNVEECNYRCSLYGNDITDDGTEPIAELLSGKLKNRLTGLLYVSHLNSIVNPHLNGLIDSLNNNNIGDTGLGRLGEALKQNRRLVSLK